MKPVLLLTGSASGIGLAIAKKLWNQNSYRVVITAREKSVQKLVSEGFSNNDSFLIRSLDVTKAEERERLIAEIESLWGGVDILINNAGISYRTVFEHMTAADTKIQFDTNFFGPMELAKLVLPKMRERRRGRIINISSVGGMMAMPTMSAYSASKFALEGASESLWYEMKPWNVNLTLVQPGFVHSESFKNVYLSSKAQNSIKNSSDPYHFYYDKMTSFVTKMMNLSVATPDSIASLILKTASQKNPPLRVSATLDAWLFGMLRRILPRQFYHSLLYKLLPGIKEWNQSHE